ncbi:MAG: ribose transport system substrate-binding protein [Frankiales bacterium]|jgi:ribose transport system substrate-binding protein|nr:ribose transport system substrate-binding protein [Frankiales bacterium]
MSDLGDQASAVARRRFLLGAAGVGAGAVLTACTSNSSKASPASSTAATTAAIGASGNDTPGASVTIGFSSPAADHGWTGAIAKNATAEAKKYSDVKLEAVQATNDVAAQIAAIQTLIGKKVDVIVMLPYDGKQLTAVALQATQAGIPVVNLDRVFDTPRASRIWIGGDNYGMGVSAGQYIGSTLKKKGVSNPVIGEIAGIDSLPLTQQRSQGFKDALSEFGYKVGPRQAAQFTVQSGQSVAAAMLSATKKFDALWNHDDDQGVGVLAAIKQANRSEFFMVGGAGSANAMREIKADNGVLKATVLYPPTMASSAIRMARLIAHSKGMSDLAQQEVPASITLYSATVDKTNVDKYLAQGFES